MIAFLVFITGLCFGSFVTMASHRLPRDEAIVRGSSRCPKCGHSLKPRDLLPLLSWVAQKGRCRHCAAKVHWRYPAIELVTAAAFLAIYAAHGLSLASLLLMLMSVGLLIMIVADFEHYIIPDEVHYLLLPLGIAYRGLHDAAWMDAGYGAALGLALGLALQYGFRALRGKEGLGTGDVKFFIVAGIWLGLLPFVSFLLLSGALGIATSLVWRAIGRGAYFPFGPALAVALFLCVVFPEVPEAFWRLQLRVYT